jgi:hypothetical protein
MDLSQAWHPDLAVTVHWPGRWQPSSVTSSCRTRGTAKWGLPIAKGNFSQWLLCQVLCGVETWPGKQMGQEEELRLQAEVQTSLRGPLGEDVNSRTPCKAGSRLWEQPPLASCWMRPYSPTAEASPPSATPAGPSQGAEHLAQLSESARVIFMAGLPGLLPCSEAKPCFRARTLPHLPDHTPPCSKAGPSSETACQFQSEQILPLHPFTMFVTSLRFLCLTK